MATWLTSNHCSIVINIRNKYLKCSVFYSIISVLGKSLDQYWPNIQLHWSMLWFPILGQHCSNAVTLYWANEQTALGLCWVPMLAHHCRQDWQVIGPTLAQYTTTLGHAWLPILGQYWANAVALCWANKQTALGLCWVPMLAHHCRQYWANIGLLAGRRV